ncbi:MAG UNVERIFIED_CONTAM: hypothetical protein LVR18_46940 [Planctomycetaceae bacterium]|jgi:hypothetical protein
MTVVPDKLAMAVADKSVAVSKRLRTCSSLSTQFSEAHVGVPNKTNSVSSINEQNPFAVHSSVDQAVTEIPGRKSGGGIGRVACLFFSGLALAASALCLLKIPLALYASVPLLITVFSAIIFARLKNLGYSALWTVALLVPVIHPTLWVELLVAPAGYAQHRTLDLPGRVCVLAVIGAILLMCALLIR